MSTSITMYNVKRVESNRTHSATIDINLFEQNTEIRAFLSDELARDLIGRLSIALATKKEGE